jgi:peptidoglycan hydrolase CwlO-like protein
MRDAKASYATVATCQAELEGLTEQIGGLAKDAEKFQGKAQAAIAKMARLQVRVAELHQTIKEKGGQCVQQLEAGITASAQGN